MTHGQLIGLLIAVALLAAVLALYAYVLRSQLGTMNQVLNCIRCNNYAVRPPSRWMWPFKDENGQTVIRILNYLNERYLKQQEEMLYLNSLLDRVDAALLVVGNDDQITWCNRTARTELLGYTPNRLQQLGELSAELPEQLASLRPGEVKTLRFEREGQNYEMAATTSRYTTKEQSLRIYSLQNIHRLLLESEQQATHRLMRVLTHEMMNSLTPIIALSDTLKEEISHPDCDWQEIRQGIEVIRRRSDGLLVFVNNYRKLAKLSPPTLQPVSLRQLLEEIRPLTYGFQTKVQFPDPDTIPADAMLQIDRAQMEQVLLNLLKNADEACRQTPSPRVEVTVETAAKQIKLYVTDNGIGITPSALDRVFIPFYTTKQKGSGIGLALCRQILLNHSGRITVQSVPGEYTRFTLHLPW